jgi:arylsulfatase A-like enzyme
MSIGCRTVACLEWPAKFPQPMRTDLPSVHMDMYPTALAAAGLKPPDQRPLDGQDLLPLLATNTQRREKPIGFMLWQKEIKDKTPLETIDFVTGTQGIWIDGSLKLIVAQAGKEGADQKNPPGLYDIHADPRDSKDLSAAQPDRVKAMRQALDAWRTSVRASFDGQDYKK